MHAADGCTPLHRAAANGGCMQRLDWRVSKSYAVEGTHAMEWLMLECIEHKMHVLEYIDAMAHASRLEIPTPLCAHASHTLFVPSWQATARHAPPCWPAALPPMQSHLSESRPCSWLVRPAMPRPLRR